MMEHITFIEDSFPVLVDCGGMAVNEFSGFYLRHRPAIEAMLGKKGAVKFMGVDIADVGDFQRITDSISHKFLEYIDGNSPRTRLSDHVYTSTEFDKTQRITMHNELSYSAKWPKRLFFSCLEVAESGGETFLADSRQLLAAIDADIVEEVQAKGVMYIRNLHGGVGFGPSWQETFETTSREKLEEYCRLYSIAAEWGKNGNLRLMQLRKGIIEHALTKEPVWFNQIDQFHPSHLDKELYETMEALYDSPKDFPTYVRFGDGTDIDGQMVERILRTAEEVTIAPAWGKNELLVVDNELVAHGRNSFSGDRKVLVAMAE